MEFASRGIITVVMARWDDGVVEEEEKEGTHGCEGGSLYM